MERTRNHIIEDQSEYILKGTLPSEWVLRKLSPDYAIDYLVEAFHESQSTGQHFFIQLKGTDKTDKDGEISYQLHRKYIEYYAKLSLPILLVYCSVSSQKLWGKWMNYSAVSKNALSRMISFSSSDLLTENSFYSIAQALSINSSPVIFKYHGMRDKQLQALIQKWVQSLFQNDLLQDDEGIADEIVFSFSRRSKGGISVKIDDKRFLLYKKVQIPINYDADLLSIPGVDPFPKSLEEFLYSLGKILLARNSKSALQLLRQLVPEKKSCEFEDILTIVAKCITNKEYREIEKLGKAAIDHENWDTYQILSLSLFKYIAEEEIIHIKESLLLYAISKSKDMPFTGMLHYNLANHYQNVNRRRDSIRHYITAVRKLPDYYNRDYWQREFAGMLFLEKRYTCSAKMYEMCLKSEKFSKEPLTFALAADANFFARRLSRSLSLFEKYSEMEKKPELEFILKRQTIKTIADRFGIEGPFSPSKSAKLFVQLEKAGELNSKEKLNECLGFDPLNPQVWFQEGILLMKEEKFEEACIAFLISALVAEWNVPAWLNSFFAAFEVKSHMMGVVLNVAYKKCGYKLIEVLREEVLDTADVPISVKKEMIEGLCAQFQMYDNESKA